MVAKKLGNSLAIEWAVGEASVAAAIEKATRRLSLGGYENTFPQATSDISHGWLVVIQTQYKTYTGRIRTSYGCGLSPTSVEEATRLATEDLRSYSWGWKTQYGFQTLESLEF